LCFEIYSDARLTGATTFHAPADASAVAIGHRTKRE
jgi:hypothetical protein